MRKKTEVEIISDDDAGDAIEDAVDDMGDAIDEDVDEVKENTGTGGRHDQ
ncbi:MAG: hypothetical protein ACQEQB_05865 [Bacteroidota bacterium]